jgi:pimeloyl-ACP methyl ester carboxylesterase
VSSFDDAQFQVHAAVLNSIVDYTRKTLKASKVALIGHSYGSYLTVASASEKLVDAIALTGFSGNLSYFAPFLAGASLRVANSLDPNRWSHLDTGYIQPVDLYATAYIYFKAPYFDHKVSSWAHGVEAQPFAVGELPSLLRSSIRYSNVKAPVLVLQGQYDLSACGGNCIGVLNGTENLFTESKALQYVDNLPAG